MVKGIAPVDREVQQQRVAQRAYAIWEQQGRPHGDDLTHWLRAENELAAASVTPARPAGAGRRKTSRGGRRAAR